MKPPVGTVSTDQHQLCLESEESTKNAIQHGGSKQTKHLQDGIFVCTHNGDPVPFLPKSVTKNLYRMRVEDSVQFEDKVDLVVAKRLSSALDLINNFDLDICRCSFNGIKFSIPNPHNVLRPFTVEVAKSGCLMWRNATKLVIFSFSSLGFAAKRAEEMTLLQTN